jgi:hypothetical protein
MGAFLQVLPLVAIVFSQLHNLSRVCGSRVAVGQRETATTGYGVSQGVSRLRGPLVHDLVSHVSLHYPETSGKAPGARMQPGDMMISASGRWSANMEWPAVQLDFEPLS